MTITVMFLLVSFPHSWLGSYQELASIPLSSLWPQHCSACRSTNWATHFTPQVMWNGELNLGSHHSPGLYLTRSPVEETESGRCDLLAGIQGSRRV